MFHVEHARSKASVPRGTGNETGSARSATVADGKDADRSTWNRSLVNATVHLVGEPNM
jgi:hypothetical protein